MECPTDTVIFLAVNSSITFNAFSFSGASVMMATLSSDPYVSITVENPYEKGEFNQTEYIIIS